MQLIGLVTLGRDAELRKVSSGDSVCSLSLAYNYGRKAEDGNKPTQWVEGSLWGKQAESLAQYMVKGAKLVVTMDDVHTEEFKRKDLTSGTKMVGRISSVEFAGGGARSDSSAAPSPRQQTAATAPRPQSRPQPQPSFGAGDDDVPF